MYPLIPSYIFSYNLNTQQNILQPLLEKLHICLLDCVWKFIHGAPCIIYPRLTFDEQQG